MAINYTIDMVELMKSRYNANPTRETVEQLAKELDKSIKSVIGKLSREGVYQKTNYTTKTGDKPVTKVELVTELADILAVDLGRVAGLEKSPKGALLVILEEVRLLSHRG